MSEQLFQEFPPVSTEQWMEQVTKDLKGADFEKKLVSTTLDGIAIRPIYRREDLPNGANAAPGLPPFLRGYKTDRNEWLNREQVREPDLKAANAHVLRSLNRGAQEISVLTYPTGVPVHSQEAMEQFLEGVFIEMVSIHWLAGPFAAPTLAMLLNEAERRGLKPDQLQGSIDLDPLVDAACGWTTAPLDGWAKRTAPLVEFILNEMPGMRALAIRGSLIEKSGASVAQELALTMALLVEYLTGLGEAGVDLRRLLPQIEIRSAVGSHYFLEIAKLRAQRVLLYNVLKGFDLEDLRPHIHVDTTSSNKTLYDPYNNLLRGTVEAMAAAVAGIDSLSVAAFDQGYHAPDEFSEHIARNTETLLKEEAFLTKVVDPLGGSYYVETLTASVADAAWRFFQQIEAEGGFIAAWQSGLIRREIDRVREAKAQRANSRRVPIIGTSVYPNLKERRLDDVRPARSQKVLRDWTEAGDLANLRRKVSVGTALADFETRETLPVSPFTPFRPSWPYEHLRLRVERHVKSGGKQPVVFLALFGNPVMRKARAGFVTGFYGAGGYSIVEPAAFADVAEAAKAAKEAGADLVVLCSSDEEYSALAGPLKQALGETRLIVAGWPADAVDQLKADGVDGFVHLKLNVVDELNATHRLLGIPEEQV